MDSKKLQNVHPGSDSPFIFNCASSSTGNWQSIYGVVIDGARPVASDYQTPNTNITHGILKLKDMRC